jgi:hypothetical protein
MKRETLAARINASGLWASYGDACEPLGYGPRGWRACAEKNWENNVRLARKDGTTDHHEDPTKGQEWMDEHPEIVLIDSILGYQTSSGGPHHHTGRMPKDKQLSAREVLMLAGQVRPTASLTIRIFDQCLLLEEWLEAAPLDAPHRTHVEDAMEQTKELLRLLASDKKENHP